VTGRRHVALAGCGAIGLRVAEGIADDVSLAAVDVDVALPENRNTPFVPEELFQPKAAVVAGRRRARGGVGYALVGDVRYVLRPGLVAAVDAVVLALDNPRAIRDAADAIWAGGRADLLVLALGCGGEDGWLARLFTVPGVCAPCLFGPDERDADRRADGASCAATSAPRAGAGAAAAAASAGARLLAAWLAGDRALAGRRVQSEHAGGPASIVRMPASPSPHCPVPHGPREPHAEIDAIGTVTVGALAERAMAAAGDDAEFLLGRRGVPLGGMYCPVCRTTWAVPPLLLPAARAVRHCRCAAPPRPLGERSTVSARELLARDVASLTLAAWGAGHGDEVRARGRRGTVRLRCRFAWEELGT